MFSEAQREIFNWKWQCCNVLINQTLDWCIINQQVSLFFWVLSPSRFTWKGSPYSKAMVGNAGTWGATILHASLASLLQRMGALPNFCRIWRGYSITDSKKSHFHKTNTAQSGLQIELLVLVAQKHYVGFSKVAKTPSVLIPISVDDSDTNTF